MKILIKNGIIIDGTRQDAYKGEILISNDTIEKIAKDNNIECNPDKIIDAMGKIVCPGFIDTHTHSDIMVFEDNYMEPKIRQGITTEIIGQDGIGPAPLPVEYIEEWKKVLAPIDGESQNIDWNYKDTKGYLEQLIKRKTSVNIMYLAPHGNIRLEAMGFSNKKATKGQLEQMKKILEREFKNGAKGLSSGLIYSPCNHADEEELVELCKVVKQYNGVFVVHQRSEGNNIINSMKEIINIGVKSGVKIHFSHFKICGKNNEYKLEEVIGLIEKAKKQGVRISFDQYPYVAGSTKLSAILPLWVHNGGVVEMIKRLMDEDIREKIKKEILEVNCDWDNFIEFAGYEGIYVSLVKSEKNKLIEGKNLLKISKLKGLSPLDCALNIIIEEEDNVEMVDFYGTEEVLKRIMTLDEQNFCTDGLVSENPHPRTYGAYAKVIRKYVNEEKLLTLEEAIYKMTKKPADVFNIKDRGTIKEGYKADLIIFNENNFVDRADFKSNNILSKGIDWCIINGEIIIENEKKSQVFSGLIL